jgi:transposase
MHENRCFPNFRGKNQKFLIRQLAIKVVMNGQKQMEVAKIFGVSRNTIGRWSSTTSVRSAMVTMSDGFMRNRYVSNIIMDN